MSIATETSRLINAKELIKAAIEAKGVTVGAIQLSDYAAKVAEIQQGSSGNPSNWVRHPEWLEIDSYVTPGEQKTVGLFAIYPNNNNFGFTNSVAFTVTGNHTINWGDGNIENVASNVQAQHIYDYDTIPAATDCVRGYRQVRITITPQSGQNISNIQFGKKHTGIIYKKVISQWLDINISGTQLTTLSFNLAYANLLENVKIYQSSAALTNASNMFTGCLALQSVALNINTSACTNMSSMFNTCTALKYIDLTSLNTSACSNMSYMFNSCSALIYIIGLNTSACTNMSYMFFACISLEKIDFTAFSTSACTRIDYAFYQTSLQSLDLSNSSLSAISSSTYFTNILGQVVNLTKCRLPGAKWSFNISNNLLSQAELVLLFGDLFDLTAQTAQTITITGNPGAAALTAGERAIATSKNWIITG